MLTFQEIILKLQDYWNKQGCALLQPVDLEVGAGTSHTATFLRAIGPEPWKAAYVQPSRRPKDGRYGGGLFACEIDSVGFGDSTAQTHRVHRDLRD